MIRLPLLITIALFALLRAALAAEWPPDNLATIRAFTFAGSPSDLIIERGKIHSSAVFKEGTILNKKQSQKAVSSLINGPNHYGGKYWCFEPRDALVFYDKDENILLAINICFTCLDWRPQIGRFILQPDFSAMAELFAELDLKGGYEFKNDAKDYKEFHQKKVEDWRKRAEARDRKTSPPAP